MILHYTILHYITLLWYSRLYYTILHYINPCQWREYFRGAAARGRTSSWHDDSGCVCLPYSQLSRTHTNTHTSYFGAALWPELHMIKRDQSELRPRQRSSLQTEIQCVQPIMRGLPAGLKLQPQRQEGVICTSSSLFCSSEHCCSIILWDLFFIRCIFSNVWSLSFKLRVLSAWLRSE